jgi:hypothetical protein
VKTTANRADKVLRSKILHASVFLVAMMSFAFNGANALAANLEPTDYRIASAEDKFKGTRLYAVALKMRPPRRLWARHLELAVGSFSTSTEDRAFISFGPVWRLPIEHRSLFVELGFSPTLIAGPSLNGRDFGGNFHFTSSVAIGATFGRRQAVSLSLRAQHTSNGGLHDTNPGIDMFGINVAFNFANR